jgi:hypothetical protein
MPKLKDFITALAKKAGYDTESATAKPFFDALPDTEVPDDIHKGIDNSLISLTDAKNNHPEIKNYYQKQSLDGVDKVLNDALSEYEFDEESRNEITGVRSTYQRVPALIKKLAELTAKKAGSGNNKDKAAIQKEIDDLHKAVATEKNSRVEDKKAFDNQMLTFKTNTKKTQLFSGIKTIHDELDPEIRFNILDSQIQKELQDNQAKFAFDDQGNFTLNKNDGTNYYGENHQQISPVKFIEQTLAKNKQIKISSPAPNNGANNSNGNQTKQTAGGDNNNGNASLIERNNQAIRDFQQSMATSGVNGMPV